MLSGIRRTWCFHFRRRILCHTHKTAKNVGTGHRLRSSLLSGPHAEVGEACVPSRMLESSNNIEDPVRKIEPTFVCAPTCGTFLEEETSRTRYSSKDGGAKKLCFSIFVHDHEMAGKKGMWHRYGGTLEIAPLQELTRCWISLGCTQRVTSDEIGHDCVVLQHPCESQKRGH